MRKRAVSRPQRASYYTLMLHNQNIIAKRLGVSPDVVETYLGQTNGLKGDRNVYEFHVGEHIFCFTGRHDRVTMAHFDPGVLDGPYSRAKLMEWRRACPDLPEVCASYIQSMAKVKASTSSANEKS